MFHYNINSCAKKWMKCYKPHQIKPMIYMISFRWEKHRSLVAAAVDWLKTVCFSPLLISLKEQILKMTTSDFQVWLSYHYVLILTIILFPPKIYRVVWAFLGSCRTFKKKIRKSLMYVRKSNSSVHVCSDLGNAQWFPLAERKQWQSNHAIFLTPVPHHRHSSRTETSRVCL